MQDDSDQRRIDRRRLLCAAAAAGVTAGAGVADGRVRAQTGGDVV